MRSKEAIFAEVQPPASPSEAGAITPVCDSNRPILSPFNPSYTNGLVDSLKAAAGSTSDHLSLPASEYRFGIGSNCLMIAGCCHGARLEACPGRQARTAERKPG